MEVKSGYYRVSIKALIFDETKTKFLLVQEDSGKWDFPGGGLDWGESPTEGLQREIKEEMGLTVLSISDRPIGFTTFTRDSDGVWSAIVFYEVTLDHLNFTPSSECIALQFVSKEEARDLYTFTSIPAALAVLPV